MIEMKLKKHTISVVINTKNEEKNIVECIASVKDFADEIVVIDMHSTDKTVEYAKKMGAHVFSVKDYGYVEPARNFGFKKATGDWILILDADERMTKTLCKKLRKVVDEGNSDIIFIPRKNIILGKWMQHTAWWPDAHPRFFRKGSVVWSDVIHSHPKYSGEVLYLEADEKYAMLHYNFPSVDDLVGKIANYTSREAHDKVKAIKTVQDLHTLLETEFKWRFVEKEGFKDEMHGYVMSEMMRFYRLLDFMKYWEKKGFKSMKGAEAVAELFSEKPEVKKTFAEKLRDLFI